MNRALKIGCESEPVLADAFAAFTAAAGRLEFSYQQLQAEVARLREELEARNAALTSSLAENEKMRAALGRILQALPCGVIVLEPEGHVSFMNPEARRLLGIGDDATDLTAGARLLLERIALTDTNLAHGQEQEICIASGDTKRFLAVHSAGVCESGLGALVSADVACGQTVLILRDATAQRDMEREREEARRLIALAEMSSVLAHEIRNPLGSLELLAGLLLNSSGLTPEQHKWIEHLQAGTRSLSATVNNVLRVHTIGTSVLVPLQLGPALREGLTFVGPLAEQAGIALSLREELGFAEIMGNRGELQQVILNLALNAFRHTLSGGRVEMTAVRGTKEKSDVALVEFSDTGCGIAPDDLPNIFETGFTTTGHSPGLGLAVCRKIVQQHGGSIGVNSRQGGGTTFRMEFPIL